MNGLHRTICAALMLSSLFAGGQALATDGDCEVAVEINKANGLLRDGDVDAAVKAYRQMQNGAPDRADLSYNMAVAQYRKGDIAAAERLFNKVSSAEDDALAAKARYNLGNCNYAAALRSAETDHPVAIKGLEKAIENYRSALAVEPNDADSRANIELAAAMIERLRDQDKKQQQQKQQQDQKQQQSKDKKEQKQESSKQQENQEKKDSQQQGKEQQQSQQKGQQKPDSSQEKNSQGEQKSHDQQQKKKDENSKNRSGDKSESQTNEQKSQSQDSKSEQKDSKSQSQEANSAADKPADPSQQRQSQASSPQKPKRQRPEQNESKQSEQAKDQQGSAAPKGELTAADEKAGKADPKSKELAGKPEIMPDGAMTIQEAEKMLQAIRDQEMIRRMRRQAAERNQRVPVDRDW
jgi:Ca-activated chloride channel family protein